MPAGEIYDGAVRIHWLPSTPANPEAITMAELGAGSNLTDYGLPDIDFGLSNATVNSPDLKTTFNAEAPGRTGAGPTVNFKRALEGGAELAWSTLGDRGITGTLVIVTGATEGLDAAIGDRYVAYTKGKTGQPTLPNVAENAEERFGVRVFVGGNVFHGALV
jgi:hypothetical protein